MNNVLKQRLVGALILLALGVVFWPIIFVEPGAPPGTATVEIPPPPQVDTSPVAPPDMAGLRSAPPPRDETRETVAGEPDAAGDDAPGSTGAVAGAPEEAGQTSPGADAIQVPAPAQTRTGAPEKPQLDAQGIPIAWVLQVASVSDAPRADKLRADLLAMGHKAYVQTVRSGGKTLYRVCVGPKAEKARLEEVRGEIDAHFGVHSLVVRYYP